MALPIILTFTAKVVGNNDGTNEAVALIAVGSDGAPAGLPISLILNTAGVRGLLTAGVNYTITIAAA